MASRRQRRLKNRLRAIKKRGFTVSSMKFRKKGSSGSKSTAWGGSLNSQVRSSTVPKTSSQDFRAEPTTPSRKIQNNNISRLGLKPETERILRLWFVETIEDLATMGRPGLLRVEGIGPARLKEINEAIARFGRGES